MSLPDSADPFRFGKAYTVSEAARLAGVPPATVRRWLAVYEDPANADRLPFIQLIEAVVVAQFRRGKRLVQIERMQRAHAFAARRFETPYPFASLELRKSGGGVLHEFDEADPHGQALTLDIGGQWAMPGCVTRTLASMDFAKADGLAERWFPAGRDVPLALDPRIGAGRLTVLGTGVTVTTIHRRFQAGETIESLVADYDLDEAAIQEAIRYADRPNRAVA